MSRNPSLMNSVLSIPNGLRSSLKSNNMEYKPNGKVRLSINGDLGQLQNLEVPKVNGWALGTSPPDVSSPEEIPIDNDGIVPEKKFSLIRSQSDILMGTF